MRRAGRRRVGRRSLRGLRRFRLHPGRARLRLARRRRRLGLSRPIGGVPTATAAYHKRQPAESDKSGGSLKQR
jgi:hypothetical protein